MKNLISKLISSFTLIALVALVYSCSGDHKDAHDHDHDATTTTTAQSDNATAQSDNATATNDN